jgi:hydroxymethylglutaryl-CoA reductase (NADPH)
MKIRDLKTIEERRKFVKDKTGRNFEAIGIFPEALRQAEKKNCENMIGAIQIPVGVAGPLKIAGSTARGEYFVPLATTEGALVASVNRGCKVASLYGGVKTYSENKGMTRGPVFEVKNINEGLKLKQWLVENHDKLQEITDTTSSHLKLLGIFTKVLGRKIYVRFSFDCQDAMGMNMVTIAVSAIVEEMEKIHKIKCISVAGNFDTDKKPAWMNFVLGRGREVWAEAVIDGKEISETLKTTAQTIHKTWLNKCLLGSVISGSMGYNAHFANIISAVFLACGQDPAHVVEGSLGVTTTELIGDKLYISVYLPDLVIGTIGGGTYLPSQKEMLDLLGVYGGNVGRNAAVFSEIIGASVLAGELSLLASLSEGSLGEAHKKLGRNK